MPKNQPKEIVYVCKEGKTDFKKRIEELALEYLSLKQELLEFSRSYDDKTIDFAKKALR